MGMTSNYYPISLVLCAEPSSSIWDIYSLGDITELMNTGRVGGIKINGVRRMVLYETPRIEEYSKKCNIEKIYEIIE